MLLFLFPFAYLISLGWSGIEVERAEAFIAGNDSSRAGAALTRAHQIWPASDGAWYLHAELLRAALAVTAKEEPAKRRILFEGAERYSAEARRRNPLRPESLIILADLRRENPDLAASGPGETSKQLYRRALALDPTAARARTGLATLLLAEGEADTARELLEEGRALFYQRRTPEVFAFYEMLAELREEQGDAEGAEDIRRQVEEKIKPRKN